jgi:hypothetical protein
VYAPTYVFPAVDAALHPLASGGLKTPESEQPAVVEKIAMRPSPPAPPSTEQPLTPPPPPVAEIIGTAPDATLNVGDASTMTPPDPPPPPPEP